MADFNVCFFKIDFGCLSECRIQVNIFNSFKYDLSQNVAFSFRRFFVELNHR